MTSEVCKGILFGTSGHVSIVEEVGKAWFKSGYTAVDDGTVALGPSRRCLHPIEALYLTRRRSLLLLDATGALQSLQASISALLLYAEYRAFAAYAVLKDTGVAIRVVHSPTSERDVLHVYYTASAYKPTDPGPPDDIVDVFSHDGPVALPQPGADSSVSEHLASKLAIVSANEVALFSVAAVTDADLVPLRKRDET